MLARIGLLNYVAGALLMPYEPFLEAARAARHDIEALAARFGVSFEQVAHRLTTLQRPGARGVPFFFLRVDPAGNVSKQFSAAGFPFARYGGSCPRWVVHTAFARPGLQVQIAELPDGAAFLCFARAIDRAPAHWGEPRPTHVVAMGCGLSHAADVVYGDGLDLAGARVGIGLVMPPVRPPRLSQPRLSAARAPAGAGPDDQERKPISVRAGGVISGKRAPETAYAIGFAGGFRRAQQRQPGEPPAARVAAT